MRILHVCECLPGGPASYLQEILPHQIDATGVEDVAVLAPRVQLPLLNDISPRLELIGYDQHKRSAASIARLFLAVRRAIRAFRPDIVHLHSTIAGLAGRLAVVTTRRAPRTVYCAHGWMIDPDRPQRLRGVIAAAEKLLSLATDRIINISPHETDFLVASGFDPARMTLIVSGIADRPSPSPVEHAEGPLNMLFIGRLDRQKGFDLLLAAMQHVAPDKAVLTVVGDAVRDAGGAAPDPSRVRYTGWLSREAVAQQMADADVVVMPSRWEGLPLVALEAMRAGKALIASNKGAFPSIVDDGATGLLINNEDAMFLASAIGGQSRATLGRMGANARLIYQQKFSAERMNKQIVSLYADILARPSRGAAI